MISISQNNPNGINTGDGPNEIKSPEDLQAAKIALAAKQLQLYLELELAMAKFLDYQTEENFELIFQDRLYATYDERMFKKFFDFDSATVIEESRRRLLNETYKKLEIESAIQKLKQKSEEVASQNGYKSNPKDKMNKMRMIMSFLPMIPIFFIYIIQDPIIYYFIIPLMCALCYLPNYYQKSVQKKWLDFKYQHQKEVTDPLIDEVNRCKNFIDILFSDARDLMLQKEFPLQMIQFQLHSNEYHNIKVVKESVVNDNVEYLVHVAYPSGMAPIPIPGQRTESQSINKPVDVNDEDLFITFPDASYDPQGRIVLNKAEYIESDILIEKIEYLLDNSDFEAVASPQQIIADYSANFSIACNDGSNIYFKEVKMATPKNYKNFKFFIIICTQCMKCQKTPFVLFKEKDSIVPDNLVEIFGKNI